jgi:hypothetical protein
MSVLIIGQSLIKADQAVREAGLDHKNVRGYDRFLQAAEHSGRIYFMEHREYLRGDESRSGNST